MPKAKLTLVSVSDAVDAEKTRSALATLYQKPESHFEPLCKHLFDLKQPFVLLKKVDLGEAEKHLKKLGEIGISCEIEKLESPDELSLVPVDTKASGNSPICPACEQESDNPEVCDQCGVIMKKFAEQQKVDEQLQNKIAAAERTEKRIKQAQLDAAEKDKADKKKNKEKPVVPEIPVEAPAEEDVFKIKVVDKSKNKVAYLAVAGALFTAVGGGYLTHSLKKAETAEGTDYNFAAEEETTASGVAEAATAVENAAQTQTTGESEEEQSLVDSTEFSRWHTRLADMEELRHQLDELNAEQNMSATMSGLITSIEDPLVKIIGEHYSAQLHLQKPDTVSQEIEPAKYSKRLSTSSAAMSNLSLSPDRLYAALNLARTYELLGNLEEAKKTYRLAETYALDTIDVGDGADIVFTEVTIAEHQVSKGQMTKAEAHFAAAIDAAETIVPDEAGDNSMQDWAIAYIVRSESKLGLFANAHNHLEVISDEQIKDIVMDDISTYAHEIDNDPEMHSLDANERDYADDPDLMLLFENTRKMKENAKKISNLTDR